MKRDVNALQEVKNRIEMLKGKFVEMSINRGRKKFETFTGIIDNVYPSVFTVKQTGVSKHLEIQTFSYFDVMCGDVVINLE